LSKADNINLLKAPRTLTGASYHFSAP